MTNKNDKVNIEDLTKTTDDAEVKEEKSGLFGFSKKNKNDENNDNENKNKNNKKKKKKQKSLVEDRKNKKKSKFKFWPFFKKYLMYPLIAFILGIFVGAIFLSSSNSDNNSKVYEIGDTVSIEDQIQNVRSSQIDAIRTQFSDMVDEGAVTQEENKIAGINSNAAKNLDPILETALNTPLNPTKDEISKREKQIESKASTDADSSKGKNELDKNAINKLVTGNNVSKELNEPGVKSGATFASVMGVDEKNNNVYMTLTPFTTKTKSVNVIHIIKTDSDGKFITGSYVGYINSNGFNRASDVYDFITNALKDNKTLDNDGNIKDTKDDKPNKEQQKQIDKINDKNKDDKKDDKKDDNKKQEDKKKDDKQQKDKK